MRTKRKRKRRKKGKKRKNRTVIVWVEAEKPPAHRHCACQIPCKNRASPNLDNHVNVDIGRLSPPWVCRCTGQFFCGEYLDAQNLPIKKPSRADRKRMLSRRRLARRDQSNQRLISRFPGRINFHDFLSNHPNVVIYIYIYI